MVIEHRLTGERFGLVAYLFTATSRRTPKRPTDEARFQIKYGSKRDNSLHALFDDPQGLWTTVLCGIDTENDLVVSVDPAAHDPTRLFVSVEYKHRHMAAIAETGWAAWSRDRRARTSRGRDIPEEQSATTETVVGAMRNHILDLVLFERAAHGLTPEYRRRLSDQWLEVRKQAAGRRTALAEHELLRRLSLQPEELLDMISGAPRLGMAVRGWAAQRHLGELLSKMPIVASVQSIETDGQPDFALTLRHPSCFGRPVLIECKNVLASQLRGWPKVDFQRTRAPKGNPCGRYYSRDEFDVVAACLHPITGAWEFRFRATKEMEDHPHCPDRLNHNVPVDARWADDLAAVLTAL